jgi:alpha-N-acetylglucosamine transferase
MITEGSPIEETAPETSTNLKKAIHQQSKIGWDHWFYGRISVHGGEMYNYDNTNKTEIIREDNERKTTATKWGKSIIELGCWNNSEHDSFVNPEARKNKKCLKK